MLRVSLARFCIQIPSGTGKRGDWLKKFVLIFFVLLFAFGGTVQAAGAGFYAGGTLWVECSSPSARSYPEYYTYCTNGGASSGTTPGTPAELPVNAYFLDYRNEYRADYTDYPVSPASYGVHFVSSDGTVYDTEYTTPPTGIMYLTCTGTYTIRMFDSATNITHETAPIQTPLITNGACASYPDGTGAGFKDFNSSGSPNGDGTYNLNWDTVPGAANYDVYRYGTKLGTANGTTYNVPSAGAYSIVAKDAGGATLGQSDITVAEATPPPATPPPGECGDVCQKLSQLMACPDWDAYMGKWGEVIRNNVPPAPNWQNVANIMRDTIVPAIAQELSNNNIPLATAIGNDLESREKPVAPPAPLPSFSPTVPTMTDLPEKIESDLNEGIPDFTPDLSGSQAFTIPDPMNWTPDNTDQGYVIPENLDNSYPTYTKTESGVIVGKAYHTAPPTAITPPTYTHGNTTANEPPPAYNGGTATPAPEPVYSGPTPAPEPAYNGGTAGEMPTYTTN